VLRLSPERGCQTTACARSKFVPRARATSTSPVLESSISVGYIYSSIGYPGASIDLLNKFDQNLMADDLRRLNPQIVVLAFGTNEASNKISTGSLPK